MKELKPLKQANTLIQEYNLNPKYCKYFSFEKEENLVRQGFEKEYLYLVLEGIIQVQFIKEDGNIISLQYKKNDGIIGEMELFAKQKGASANVSAKTFSICLAYPYTFAQQELESNLIFVRRIAKDLTHKLQGITNAYALTQGNRGENRVCYFLNTTNKTGIYTDTQKRISIETGISYRQVSRILKKLCEENILRKESYGYKIIDEKSLRKKAEH